jgi:hypothetical protein
MKNLPVILVGALSIGATIFTYMLYRKDKEIEKNCGCKNPVKNGNGSTVSASRLSPVAVNGMTGIGGGVGGGRSAMEIEFIKPRGIATVTFGGGSDPDNSAIFENRMNKAPYNRLQQFNEKLKENYLILDTPVVIGRQSRGVQVEPSSAIEGRVISNDPRSAAANLG